MNGETLDDYIVHHDQDNSNSIKKFFIKYKQLFPVLILTGICVFTFVEIFESKVDIISSVQLLSLKNYLAFFLLILNYLIFYYWRKTYKYILIATLLIGLFNLINFNLGEYNLYLGSEIGIQPFITLILILMFFINFKTVKNFFFERGNTEVIDEKIKKSEQKQKIEMFKKKYQSYSLENLEMILSDNRYVYEAKEAAKELLLYSDMERNKE